MVRVTQSTLAEVDDYATRLGISRNAAIVVLIDHALGHSPDPRWSRLEHTSPIDRVKIRTERAMTRSGQARLSSGKLRKQLTPGDREHFFEAVDELVKEGRLVDTYEGGVVYLSLPPQHTTDQ